MKQRGQHNLDHSAKIGSRVADAYLGQRSVAKYDPAASHRLQLRLPHPQFLAADLAQRQVRAEAKKSGPNGPSMRCRHLTRPRQLVGRNAKPVTIAAQFGVHRSPSRSVARRLSSSCSQTTSGPEADPCGSVAGGISGYRQIRRRPCPNRANADESRDANTT